MRVENRNLTWTVMPLLLAGVFCDTWKVVYHQQHICVARGSPVVIPCSFYYPDGQRVKKVMWSYVKSHHFKGRFISATTKFQYIGDKRHNCSLKIHQVEPSDAGIYVFRFVTHSEQGKWIGKGGPTLTVADLNVSLTKPNGPTREGDSVNLTCVDGCDLSPAFTWFKNGEPIHEGPVLHLSKMSSASSGNYTCSLKTHQGTITGATHINVEYGPKNTSVSSMEVDASGSAAALICSSHANPPVENYTWFKVRGDGDIMDAGHQPEFFPGDGGRYFCRATNKHGSQNSSVVTLKIKPHWATFTVLIITSVAVLLIVIIVIAVRRRRKRRTAEADSEGDVQDTDYVNWLPCDSNQCEVETAEVVYTAVYFNNKRTSNKEQQMDSHTDDQGVIYITACRNQLSYLEPP